MLTQNLISQNATSRILARNTTCEGTFKFAQLPSELQSLVVSFLCLDNNPYGNTLKAYKNFLPFSQASYASYQLHDKSLNSPLFPLISLTSSFPTNMLKACVEENENSSQKCEKETQLLFCHTIFARITTASLRVRNNQYSFRYLINSNNLCDLKIFIEGSTDNNANSSSSLPIQKIFKDIKRLEITEPLLNLSLSQSGYFLLTQKQDKFNLLGYSIKTTNVPIHSSRTFEKSKEFQYALSTIAKNKAFNSLMMNQTDRMLELALNYPLFFHIDNPINLEIILAKVANYINHHKFFPFCNIFKNVKGINIFEDIPPHKVNDALEFFWENIIYENPLEPKILEQKIQHLLNLASLLILESWDKQELLSLFNHLIHGNKPLKKLDFIYNILYLGKKTEIASTFSPQNILQNLERLKLLSSLVDIFSTKRISEVYIYSTNILNKSDNWRNSFNKLLKINYPSRFAQNLPKILEYNEDRIQTLYSILSNSINLNFMDIFEQLLNLNNQELNRLKSYKNALDNNKLDLPTFYAEQAYWIKNFRAKILIQLVDISEETFQVIISNIVFILANSLIFKNPPSIFVRNNPDIILLELLLTHINSIKNFSIDKLKLFFILIKNNFITLNKNIINLFCNKTLEEIQQFLIKIKQLSTHNINTTYALENFEIISLIGADNINRATNLIVLIERKYKQKLDLSHNNLLITFLSYSLDEANAFISLLNNESILNRESGLSLAEHFSMVLADLKFIPS